MNVTTATGSTTLLRPDQLRNLCDPSTLSLDHVPQSGPMGSLVGQDRALRSLKFGAGIGQPGYNLFALGPESTGRHTAVKQFLESKVCTETASDDWIYVHDFANAHAPRALRLPPGCAKPFSEAMSDLIAELRQAIPAMFQSEEYREKQHAIDTENSERQEKAFEELKEKAESQQVSILRTPMGFALAPMHEGNVIKPEVFELLPKEQRDAIEKKMAELQKDLTQVLERMPELEKAHRDKLRRLVSEMSGITVDASIKQLATRFADCQTIQERLEEVRKDLIDNSSLFIEMPQGEEGVPSATNVLPGDTDLRFNRYLVNVMVANDSDGDHKGAPLVIEDHPTLGNLVGRIEHLSQFGTLVTDFTMIRPGALHRANGGYLVLDARRVLTEMFSWEALKRALHANAVTITSAADQLSLASTISLAPEPIPLDVKIVLIGDRMLYYLLSTLDPDFPELFKVEVDFDDDCPRSDENLRLYAQMIMRIARDEELRPLDAGGLARVIDEVTRMADDAERLSLRIGLLADLLREADFWTGQAGSDQICTTYVEKALEEQRFRGDRLRERSLEMIQRETVLIDTLGESTGQVNGLAVTGFGNKSFGRPSRITARVRMGSGKVVDIERESRLGGPLHSKGVLILSSYLASNYALDTPMSLWASLVFEQSYGGVDGDSASSAELYALLSALADAPIKQSLAVTGSVNQHGQIQAIGGVNEKIEGFFDVCCTRGLTGDQGVLIPVANVKNLMLRPDVVAAAERKEFHIHAVETVEQGIALLTNTEAGVRDTKGQFPSNSVNGRVEQRLRQFAVTRKAFNADSDADSGERQL